MSPLKIIIVNLKDICDHMLKWMMFEMKDLACDLEHGTGPCWKGQIKSSSWKWDNASADPKSRVWPEANDCDVFNEAEKFASKLISVKIAGVLNPCGWANAIGPVGSKSIDYSKKASFKDLDQQWFRDAVCKVFKHAFADPQHNTIGSLSEKEMDNTGWTEVPGTGKNGHLIARWQRKGSSAARMILEDLDPFWVAMKAQTETHNSEQQHVAAVSIRVFNSPPVPV